MTPQGYVLYDAACGFCSWWIPFWKKTINKTGYDIAPLQAQATSTPNVEDAGEVSRHCWINAFVLPSSPV